MLAPFPEEEEEESVEEEVEELEKEVEEAEKIEEEETTEREEGEEEEVEEEKEREVEEVKPRRKAERERTAQKVASREVKIQRVPLGVDALDDALEGGVPRGSWIVIGGEPGTGKSILAIHFAWKGLEEGDKIIYVTTEQEFYDVILQAKQFGMDLDEYRVFNLAEAVQWDRADREWHFERPEQTPDIVVIDLFGLSRVAKLALQEQLQSSREGKKTTTRRVYAPWSIDTLIYALDRAYEILEVERGQHVRLVIDSMSTFWVDKPAMARKYSYQLKLAYHRSNITAFLTSQYASTTKGIFGFGVEHIADVVMETWMTDVKAVKRVERYLAVKKARMTAIKHTTFRIEFVKEGDKSKLVLVPV